MRNSSSALLYSLASAALLALAWYFHLGILIFFGFVPLLILEDKFRSGTIGSPLKFFALVYLSFLAWNILVTWWIVYASLGGAILAFVANALLMSIVFVIYSFLKRSFRSKYAVWTLIPLWLAFEYIHTLWSITWTWLSIGNVFANHHYWIQWYSFTGVSGGTAWVLAVNIFCFRLIKENKVKSLFSKQVAYLFLAIIIPIVISYGILLGSSAPKEKALEVVVVQPNMDPYNVKFSTTYESQLATTFNLIRQKITANTAYLALPETFITGFNGPLNEDNINDLPEIKWFRDSLLLQYPQLRIVAGADTYKYYSLLETPSATARKDSRNDLYLDFYNTALFITSDSCSLYHKSKLVPGVEMMPFPRFFKLFENFAIDLGGTTGSLGTQSIRSVFKDPQKNIGIAPVICYESVYGDFVAKYIRNGANVIFIITNDGWWDNTPGHQQHLQYARLRAIENRRPIVRCANTGISCFVDQMGNLSQETKYWEPAVISQTIKPNNELTFFSKFGDVLSYLSCLISLILVIFLPFYLRRKANTKADLKS